jgi:flagellum-specific peptidoglycan hydrolase FlgJ
VTTLYTDHRLLPFVVPVQESHKKYWPKGPFVSVTLVQIAVEANYGESPSGDFNLFGVKATKAQIKAGKAKLRMTKEFEFGRFISKTLYFANYGSYREAIDAHSELLIQSWYKECIEAQTPEEYIVALQKEHYATAPNYSEVLLKTLKENNLKQFDQTF